MSNVEVYKLHPGLIFSCGVGLCQNYYVFV